MAPHSSILAWKIPWTEEPGRLQSMGSLRVRHDWTTSLSLFTFMHWRRKRQPTPVFLPGESQGWGSLVGRCLWGHTESDTTEASLQQQHILIYLLNLDFFVHNFCFCFYYQIFFCFLWFITYLADSDSVKNLPAIQKTWVWSLNQKESLQMGIATHSSILYWRIPRTEQPGGFTGHKKSDTTEWLTYTGISIWYLIYF